MFAIACRFTTWEPLFDQHGAAQRTAGLANRRLFGSADDLNEIGAAKDGSSAGQGSQTAKLDGLQELWSYPLDLIQCAPEVERNYGTLCRPDRLL